MSGIVGSRLNIRGSGVVGGLGTDGQLLTSSGAGQEIVFESAGTAAVTALNNATQSELVTVGSTTTELDAEANLTFTGSALTCIGTVTVGVDNTGHDVKYFGATSGSYWLWDEDADGVVQIGTLTVGVNDAGHDVKFFGNAASAYMLWDTSADDLILAGGAGLIVPDGQFTLGSTAVSSTAAEINLIDGGTSRGTTAVASGDGILINDAGTMAMTNVDTVSTYFASHSVGGGNIVTTGALDTGSITSGFGTIDTGSSTITTTGLISGGSLDIDNVLINGTTIGHTDDTDLLTLADGALTALGTITVGVDDAGHDVKLFGNAAGAYFEWDASADELRIMGASADATTSTGKLLLATSLTDINANDVIGKIDFQAPHEAGGTDAITVAASIQAIAQSTFSSSSNATDLIFYTGHSEAAAEKVRITSQNEIGIAGANYGTDGQVLTSGGAGAAVAWEDAGGGTSNLEELDIWNLTTAFTGSATPIASNLSRCDSVGFSLLGTGMSESSGIFTFPSTGYWRVFYKTDHALAGSGTAYVYNEVQVTTDNSSYASVSRFMIGEADTSGYTSGSTEYFFDVTSTTNCKVKFTVNVGLDNVSTLHKGNGGAEEMFTFMSFMKLSPT
jgi:hypothetical protein